MRMHADSAHFELAIWARLMDGPNREIPPEAARFLLSIEFGERDRRRMRYLSERSEVGALTPEEDAEFDGYLHVGTVLGLMQSKARCALGLPFPLQAEPS